MLLIFAAILLICHTVHGVSVQCTSNCQNCTQQNTCDLCKHGYYKSKNKCAKCHFSCTRCSSLSECLTCAESYVFSDRWCYNCSYICDDCSEPGCKVCKSGYHVTSNKGCNRCRENCKMCSTGTSCDSCIDGYYLQTSKCIECPERCLERQCSRDNGECSKGCVVGFYAQFCNLSCSEGCRDKACSTDKGICTNGCKEGYYGSSCQRCPEVCINRTCSASDGRCINGCVNGYYKSNKEIPKSQQRPLVPAILGSALGGLLFVASLCALVLVARWRLKQKPKSNKGADTDVPCIMQTAIHNSSAGNDENIVSLSKQSDAAGHVYAVVLETCHLNQKRSNVDIDQCIADDNVYDVSTTEWKQKSSQRPPKAEAVQPGVETYTHIIHVNKTRRDGQHKDEEMVYDHVAYELVCQGNEGTYDVARIFQGNKQYKGTEMMMASSRQYYGDGSYDFTYSHSNHQFTRENADDTIYNTASDLMLPHNR